MSAVRRPTGVWSQVFLALATLAILVKVLAPPGFMIGAPSRDGAAFPIVLCTAQGEIVMDGAKATGAHEAQDHGPAHDPGKSSHDSPCAFAGHGLAAPLPSLAAADAVAFAVYAAPAPRAFPVVSPGRGLSGPPLPARGPPALLT